MDASIISIIQTFITTIGFPVAVAAYLLYYIRQQGEQHKEETKQIVEQHREETKEMTAALADLRVVMQNLIDKLEKE